ncbi:MAG: nuclear transport factor 2 family protein [Rubrivivax sp.]
MHHEALVDFKCEEIGCDFVDYFSVARIDGCWQITNKTYAHTGGQAPSR